jgi:hypothetical protein
MAIVLCQFFLVKDKVGWGALLQLWGLDHTTEVMSTVEAW